MGYKPNNTKGVEPTEKTLYYKKTNEDGSTEFASVAAYAKDPNGVYKAWVHHPTFGLELMNEKEGRLDSFEAVIAVTQDDVPALIEDVVKAVSEKYEARIARLEAALQTSGKTIKARVLAPATEKQLCDACGYEAKSKAGLAAHSRHCDALKAQTV